MQSNTSNVQEVRQRKIHDHETPPAPEKPTVSARSFAPPPAQKPLPAPPRHDPPIAITSKKLPPKPLPDLPGTETTARRLDYQKTLLWLFGFVLWFLLIAVLLPVITERDAMPGFNRSIRTWIRRLLS